MLRIQFAQDKEPLDIPVEVEHAGEVAIDFYVREKTGVDLAAQRKVAAAAAEARAAEETRKEAADIEAAQPKPDPAIAGAIDAARAAAIPINPASAPARSLPARGKAPSTPEE